MIDIAKARALCEAQYGAKSDPEVFRAAALDLIHEALTELEAAYQRLRLAEEVCESTDRYMTNPDWPHPREGMDVMADLATWRKVKIEP
jgi:hypothetical protein